MHKPKPVCLFTVALVQRRINVNPRRGSLQLDLVSHFGICLHHNQQKRAAIYGIVRS